MAGKSYPGWVFLLAGLFIGLFIAFLFYLQQRPSVAKPSLQDAKNEVIKLREEKLKAKQKNGDTETKTDFDFYNILPELEVVVPGFENDKKTQEKTDTSTNNTVKTDTNNDYLLQVGSFGDKSQAEQFKAKLAFLGLQAFIQSVSINSKQWYRVRLGPYSDTQSLQKDQQRLTENQIKSIVLKLKD